MFVLTAKVSKTKLAAIVTLILAIVVVTVVALTVRKQGAPAGQTADADSNEARVTFLAGYGWDVNAEPIEVQTVTVPSSEDSPVFARYNELQRSQGYDLSQYAGQEATRYVYEILNYPEAEEPVYATVLVRDGQVIGGDVTNTAEDGAMHGFAAPSSVS